MVGLKTGSTLTGLWGPSTTQSFFRLVLKWILTLLDDETVREGRDLQHVEQRRLGRSHLVILLDEVNLVLKYKDAV